VTDLLGRRAVVEIGDVTVDGLDVRFTVEHTKKGFGKAEIVILNLGSENRKAIELTKELPVSLLAGYQQTALSLLFKGIVRESFSVRTPPDWATTLRNGDGDKARKVRINRSYKPKTPKTLVWKDLVESLKAIGVGAGNAIEKFQQGDFKDGISEMLHGGAIQGSTLKEIRLLARSANLDVVIQDQELVVTEIGQPLATTAVKLTPQTGLIGSPQKGVKGELRARALIVPGLKPKRTVQIESRAFSGLYVIANARYKGDTASNDWYVDLECNEV
jgi:hypothetical protein